MLKADLRRSSLLVEVTNRQVASVYKIASSRASRIWPTRKTYKHRWNGLHLCVCLSGNDTGLSPLSERKRPRKSVVIYTEAITGTILPYLPTLRPSTLSTRACTFTSVPTVTGLLFACVGIGWCLGQLVGRPSQWMVGWVGR